MATRRDVLAGALSVLFAGGAAAQGKIFRSAYLSGSGGRAPLAPRRPLFGRLEELGYREGQNLVVDRRLAEGRPDRLPALAAELVALKPDTLFAMSTQAAVAASKATKTIPIVFVAVTDPVSLGLIRNKALFLTMHHPIYSADDHHAGSGRAFCESHL